MAQLREAPGQWTLWQYFGAILAGPMANLATVFLLWPFYPAGTAFSAICVSFAAISGLVALTSLVPHRVSRSSSDGTKLAWILFSKKQRKNFVFLLTVSLRLLEIVTMSRENRNDEALQCAEEFISIYKSLPHPDLDSEFFKKIVAMRNNLELHRNCGEVCQVTPS